MRLSYLPPLMVYVAAGISGLTGIVGTFYVKEKLGLSAEFLAMLGFWMMLPWHSRCHWAIWSIWYGDGRACWCIWGQSDHAELAHHDRITWAYRSNDSHSIC